jgi:hypothetical protein
VAISSLSAAHALSHWHGMGLPVPAAGQRSGRHAPGGTPMAYAEIGYSEPSFAKQLLTKVLLLMLTIIIVWVVYAWLHAFRLEWLGWIYSKLLPLTNGLYALVETYFPADVKFKIRGAITDDLGQRSLFLLLLTAMVELLLFSLFKMLGRLYRMMAVR